MKTLAEIKDEVARENGKPNWDELLYWGSSSDGFEFPSAIDQVAKRYAEQALDAAVEELNFERYCENSSWGRTETSILKIKDELE